MRREVTPSWPISIFIAGAVEEIRAACLRFCDEVGLCVTVTPTTYVYTGGQENGAIVGLINYPRFPSNPDEQTARAEVLALRLIKELSQESASIQTPEKTIWLSFRAQDVETKS